MSISKKTKIGVLVITGILLTGLAMPESIVIPVQGATSRDWNHDTFWYTPWGSSGVHKGIDIFSSLGTPVISTTYGVVLFKGQIKKGGKVIVILGPKWRLHYYAHLNNINVSLGEFISIAKIIGSVGNSGNASDKPPHLHYSMLTLIPYLWRIYASMQGWKKMFFLNPSERLKEVHSN
jgi:murein DD-endopeptidase MepM/ murein hydrolase activator NlpD